MDVIWWVPAGIAFIGILFGILMHMIYDRVRGSAAVHQAQSIKAQAKRSADNTAREAEILARNEVVKARENFEHEASTRRQELLAMEDRLVQREINLDRRLALVDKKEQTLEDKLGDLEQQKTALQEAGVTIQKMNENLRAKLQETAVLPRDEARRQLLAQVEEELRSETSQFIRRSQQQAQAEAQREARKIVIQAIERYAAPIVNEVAVCTVTLPSEEMKGRIIGREGRNIRTIEQACGVQILIDDTPGVSSRHAACRSWSMTHPASSRFRASTRSGAKSHASRWSSSSPMAASNRRASRRSSQKSSRTLTRSCSRRPNRRWPSWACRALRRKSHACWAGSSSARAMRRTFLHTRWRPRG
ncbi:MAG: Rnase Y domain-containing protein [Kiritimatiellaeota bacterium]|nr:Rnase Y domain-containing protein [Kiritimatiellota bacterium]